MFYKILKVLDIIFMLAFIVVGSIYATAILLLLMNYFHTISITLGDGFVVLVGLSSWMLIREGFMEIIEDIFKKSK